MDSTYISESRVTYILVLYYMQFGQKEIFHTSWLETHTKSMFYIVISLQYMLPDGTSKSMQEDVCQNQDHRYHHHVCCPHHDSDCCICGMNFFPHLLFTAFSQKLCEIFIVLRSFYNDKWWMITLLYIIATDSVLSKVRGTKIEKCDSCFLTLHCLLKVLF